MLQKKELAVVHFGSSYCIHSNRLQHVINDVPKLLNNSNVIFVYVDCRDSNFRTTCFRHQISKIPTIKFIYLGVLLSIEYREERSSEAISRFIQTILKPNVHSVYDAVELEEITPEVDHRVVIGFFRNENAKTLTRYRQISGIFMNECRFYAYISKLNTNTLFAIRDPALGDEVYVGDYDVNSLFKWVRLNCKPLIKSMTFDNAEGIVERRLPLLVLYRQNKNYLRSLMAFTRKVDEELSDLIGVNITAVHVNREVFKNAVRLSGAQSVKGAFVQIDTLKHNYNLPYTPGMPNKNGALRTMVIDILKNKSELKTRASVFVKLLPSNTRYSFITSFFDDLKPGKDEL